MPAVKDFIRLPLEIIVGWWILSALLAEIVEFIHDRSIKKWLLKQMGSFFEKMELIRLIMLTLYIVQYVAVPYMMAAERLLWYVAV